MPGRVGFGVMRITCEGSASASWTYADVFDAVAGAPLIRGEAGAWQVAPPRDSFGAYPAPEAPPVSESHQPAHPPEPTPYDTRLEVYYEPLDVVDVQRLADACTHPWYNQTLCRVNESVVRLGVLRGEYHWHKHGDLDEFFFVVEGRFLIDLEGPPGRTIELMPRQGLVVPKGVVHRTRAPDRGVVLMVEGAGIVPTGDR
jgi:mannose-6-phosphate isomerase-like protein (cupin superfamily)